MCGHQHPWFFIGFVPTDSHVHDKVVGLGDGASSQEASIARMKCLQILRHFSCLGFAVDVFAPFHTYCATHTEYHPEPFGEFGRSKLSVSNHMDLLPLSPWSRSQGLYHRSQHCFLVLETAVAPAVEYQPEQRNGASFVRQGCIQHIDGCATSDPLCPIQH